MSNRNFAPFLLALGLFTLGALLFGSPKAFAGSDTFDGTLDVAILGPNAHISAPDTRVFIGGTGSGSNYTVTVADACTNATAGTPGMNVTYNGVTKSSNSATNCEGANIVFRNVPANHTLVASKINGQGHQPFRVTVSHPSDNGVYVTQLENPNRKLSGWGSNDENSSFTVWAGEGYKVRFESDCSSDTVFFKWQDADDGNGDNSYQNASLDVKYVGPGGSPVKVVTKKNLGGQGQSRYVPIDLDPEFATYEIIWHGISSGNAVKMVAPFARNPGKVCNPPGGGPISTPGSVTPECTRLVVKNGDGVGNGTYYHTPGGADYKTNTVVNVENVTPGVSGTYSNSGGGSGAIVGFGATSSPWNYIPTQPSIVVKTYQIYHNTSTGKWGKVTGSDTSQTINCYSAKCNMYYVVPNAPNGKVKHNSPFSVKVLVENNGAAPLRDYLEGSTLQLQNNGGDIGFSQQVPGMDAGGGNYYHYITFTATAPASGSSATIVAQMAYSGNFFLGSSCSIPVNLYQGPTIGISAAGACFQIYGTAVSPELPDTSIIVHMYVDGGAGPYIYVASGPGHTYGIDVPSIYRDGNDHTFHLYAIDPYGSENGGPADVTMTGCSAFHLEPNSYNGQLAPDSEDPTSFSAASSITATYENGWGGPAGGVPGTASTWYKRDGVNVTPAVAYPFNTFINRTHVPGPYSIPTGDFVAGTNYCLAVRVYYTDGFVDRNGNVFPGSYGDKTDDDGCDHVRNKPYFKVYNGGISAGGEFSSAGTGCENPANEGILAGYNTAGAGYDFGSSAHLTALAMREITGVASNQTKYDKSPYGLSFANTTNVVTAQAYNPSLGGMFNTNPGATSCLTSAEPDPDKPKQAIGNGPIDAGMEGQYVYTGATPLVISGGLIGHNVAIFSDNAPVYISNDITYAGSTNWTKDNIPSLVIRAKGNIYIDANVGKLDGIYIAEKANSKISTCSQISGTTVSLVPNDSSYFDTCHKQLTVHGSFVADHINLMRTYGTMRDEKPTTPVNLTTNGNTYSSCTPTAISFCGTSGSAVYSYDNYDVSYALSNPAATNYEITLDYANNNSVGGSGGWPPPSGASYKYNVDVYVNGTKAISDWQLALSAGSQSATRSLGSVPANATIRISWTNNYWLNASGTAQTGGGIIQTVYDPNLQINSFNLSTSSVPSGLNCSNNGSGNVGLGTLHTFDRVVGGTSSGRTCASEVFDFSPEQYLSHPAIAPPNFGAPIWDSITSLPPVL